MDGVIVLAVLAVWIGLVVGTMVLSLVKIWQELKRIAVALETARVNLLGSVVGSKSSGEGSPSHLDTLRIGRMW